MHTGTMYVLIHFLQYVFNKTKFIGYQVVCIFSQNLPCICTDVCVVITYIKRKKKENSSFF